MQLWSVAPWVVMRKGLVRAGVTTSEEVLRVTKAQSMGDTPEVKPTAAETDTETRKRENAEIGK